VNEVLQALRYGVLAALVLFAYRAVRAVADDVRAAAAEAPWAVLLVEEGPGLSPGEAFAVRAEAVVGRAEANQVVVPDPEVAPQHARLVARGDGFWLEDLGGPGGTYLNGRRLEAPAPVRHGDRVRVGSTVLRVIQPGRAREGRR
jgi:pSer/pThr/pTyr-binding forkhead associated (FHA) protein